MGFVLAVVVGLITGFELLSALAYVPLLPTLAGITYGPWDPKLNYKHLLLLLLNQLGNDLLEVIHAVHNIIYTAEDLASHVFQALFETVH